MGSITEECSRKKTYTSHVKTCSASEKDALFCTAINKKKDLLWAPVYYDASLRNGVFCSCGKLSHECFLLRGNQAATVVRRRNDRFRFLAESRYEYNWRSQNSAGVIVSCVDLADAKQEGAPWKDVFQLGSHPRVQSVILGDPRLLAFT